MEQSFSERWPWGLLFEIGTQVWNENPRKTFHRWYFSPEVDPWQAVVAAG
jgi:hypothetical protein